MLKDKIIRRLQEMNQLHLGKHLDLLSEEEKSEFFQIVSSELLKSQQERLKQMTPPQVFEPILEAESASDQWTALGIERLTKSKAACLILAGGQGSRLGASLPKALVSVTPDGKKSLLELQLEKIAAASIFHQTQIPCAVMTSPENHAQIARFLKERCFCGLDEKLLTLVTQKMAPFLDEQSNWILRENGKLASGPDGNGHALHLLESEGVLSAWEKRGIQEIMITQIDNALADPVDPILIGYHAAHPAEVTVKVIRRQNAEERVGVIVRKEGRIEVQEYSERGQNQPPQALAHTGLFALNLSFARQLSQIEFPWHLARKQDVATGKWVWKFERFIFDMLSHSQKTNLLLYPREDVYAPLKNAFGEKSLATVQEALKKLILKEVS